jgi:cell division protein FtsN
MEPETGGGAGGGRELRLEGPVLYVVVVALLGAVALAFWAGRWFERQTAPAPPIAAQEGRGHEAGDEPKADDVTFFDTLGGGGRAAEPEREVRPKSEAGPPSAPPAAAPRSGTFCVQVFAGRDRQAAEEIVRSLSGRGYAVTVQGEREGRGALYKVRVGGYADRGEAQAVAERLKREGQPGAWVTRRD